MRLGLHFLARTGPSPARRFEIRMPDAGCELVFHVHGGAEGTRVTPPAGDADVVLFAEPLPLVELVSGVLGARV